MTQDLRDDWDASTSVGVTATEAAAARAVAGRRHTPLVNDPYAEPLVRAVGVDFLTELLDHDGEGEPEFALPHMVDWVAARTRFFDDYIIAAQQADIRQFVIVGAGLDTRAYRLPWSPLTTLFEIDQPGVIEFKNDTMTRLKAAPSTDRRLVAVDLRHDWVSLLLKSGFDRSQPTAWCAEGLLPYLDREGQDKLLDNISAFSAANSWFAADTVDDMRLLAEQIAGVRELRPGVQLDTSANDRDGRCASRDVASRLRGHGWGSLCFAAQQLFTAYEVPLPTAAEQLYQRIAFVTAFTGATCEPIEIPWGI